ncbi:hypothetical protein BMS3Bbin12_02085 [bacterium BMS3Bbin12]|nr:hypothetical protein BMS3Bbin12_02085 [bacterium BMS3Bbin12]GBE49798.1 hypothetical protein BMS3Bbin13_00721 [bacterium BMS3Bbin13]
MSGLVLQPSAAAQWHALVEEAQRVCRCDLGEDVESYLVFLLMRFTGEPQLAARVMALDYLRALDSYGTRRAERLRDVGDQCLLFSGLFPGRGERRLVSPGYFVGLGRSAYCELAATRTRGLHALFERLAATFVSLMDVLQATREVNGGAGVDLLRAAELWHETGSRRAFERLSSAGGAVPGPPAPVGGPVH